MKEKTKNNGFSLDTLLDSEYTIRRAAISAINNIGKIIALFVSILTVAVTFTEVSFGAVLSESFGRDGLDWENAWPAFARAVIRGYDAVSSLTAAEWQAAPTLMLGNELLALAAFADSSKYRHVFDTNRCMLSWMLDHMPL